MCLTCIGIPVLQASSRGDSGLDPLPASTFVRLMQLLGIGSKFGLSSFCSLLLQELRERLNLTSLTKLSSADIELLTRAAANDPNGHLFQARAGPLCVHVARCPSMWLAVRPCGPLWAPDPHFGLTRRPNVHLRAKTCHAPESRHPLSSRPNHGGTASTCTPSCPQVAMELANEATKGTAHVVSFTPSPPQLGWT